MLNLSEAARVSGQSKSTIWRVIHSGRLSVTRTYTGDYQIDPSELHRVFSSGTGEARATPMPAKREVSVERDATELARAETALQINRLFQVGEVIRRELDNNRDAWRTQADRLRQLVG
jgi:predicted site-specific integrase-resolvase